MRLSVVRTLVVNMFGGPGVGKSTNSSLLFGKLKNMGINAEYVSEYAKELVWEGRGEALSFQPYVSAKQMMRQFRVMGKVDVIITDSPILLGIIYGGLYTTENFDKYLLDMHRCFTNYNILLQRNNKAHRWNPEGRTQTEQEAEGIDTRIQAMLDTNHIPYDIVPVWQGELTPNYLVGLVLAQLN